MAALSVRARIGLVELFRPVLISSWQPTEMLSELTQILGSKEVEGIQGLYLFDKNVANKALLDALIDNEHPAWFEAFLSIVGRDKALANIYLGLKCDGVKDLKRYESLLAQWNKLEESISNKTIQLAEELVKLQCLNNDDLERIKIQSKIDALRLLLQLVPKTKANWYWDLMDTINNIPCLIGLVDQLHPHYQSDKEKHQFLETTQPDCNIHFVPTHSVNFNQPITIHDSKESIWRRNNIENSAFATIESSRSSVKELLLRGYQKELIQTSLEGINSILIAPTGSGKTIAAVAIIKQHLVKYSPNGKVAFLVPTTQLVAQQTNVIQEYLSDKYKIKGLSGLDVDGLRLPIIRASDIIVMTPALMSGMMRRTGENERIDLVDFSLLILDECHHTNKDYPYNQIMNDYFDLKEGIGGLLPKGRKLPQIVGLTASLGTGKAANLEQAVQYVLSICSNLDIGGVRALATVKHQKEELAKIANLQRDSEILASPKYQTHPFSKLLLETMKQVERHGQVQINEAVRQLKDYSIQIPKNPPDQRWADEYTGWVCNLLAKLPVLMDGVLKQDVLSHLEHLRIYHNALLINAHVPTKQAVSYLEREMNEKQMRMTSPTDKFLIDCYAECQSKFKTIWQDYSEEDMVEKLKSALINEYNANPDSRTIIFAKTRELTMALESFMKEDTELSKLGPCRLVAVNAPSANAGQTPAEQQDILKKFGSGEKKILIATTVAEEGLDIQKCNLVIKYNNCSNEIAMIQRRGRGRAELSKSVLLTEDPKVVEKEKTNLMREKLMEEAIAKVQNFPPEAFDRALLVNQNTNYRRRKMREDAEAAKRTELSNHCYQLMCCKCDEVICESTMIKNIEESHFVIVDPEIWSRVVVEPINCPKNFATMAVAGRFSCVRCRKPFGTMIKSRNVFFPALKATSFVMIKISLTNTGQPEKRREKKWKDVKNNCFNVKPIEEIDFVRMSNSLKTDIGKVVEQKFLNNNEQADLLLR